MTWHTSRAYVAQRAAQGRYRLNRKVGHEEKSGWSLCNFSWIPFCGRLSLLRDRLLTALLQSKALLFFDIGPWGGWINFEQIA
jgi:hypothetical protein